MSKPPQDFTFNDLADAYERDREQAGKRMASIKGALKAVRQHFGDYEPRQIGSEQVREFIAKRPYYGRDAKKPRPVEKSTIDKEIRFLKQVLRYGRREGWGVEVPDIQGTGSNPPRERYLTREEYAQIYEHAAPHLQLFMTLATQTARRKEALLSLKWSHVDFARNMIWAEGGNATKRRAAVQMSGKLREALEGAHKRAQSDYVIEFRGERIKDIKRAWMRARERAGVSGVRIHDLRRTAASWMLENGATFAQTAAVLGDTEEMVRKHYGKFSPGFMRAAVDLIG